MSDRVNAKLNTDNARIQICDEATARAAFEVLRPILSYYDIELHEVITSSKPAREGGEETNQVSTSCPEPSGESDDEGGKQITQVDTSYSLDHTNPYHLQWAYEEADGVVGRSANYFDVTDERVRDKLVEAGIHEPEEVAGDPGYRDPDQLRRVFEENDRDVGETAAVFDVSDRTIRVWLSRFDIPDEPRYRDPDILADAFAECDEVVTRTAEQFDASETTIRKWLREFDLLENGSDAPSPTEETVTSSESEAGGDTEAEEERWCGYCGYGPKSEHGVRVHTGRTHNAAPILWEVEPSEEDLQEEPASDGPEDGSGETESEPSDGGESSRIREEDSESTRIQIEEIQDEEKPRWTDYSNGHRDGSLSGLTVPDHVSKDDIYESVESGRCSTILDVAQELRWPQTGRVRTALQRLGLYTELSDPEGYDPDTVSQVVEDGR